MLLIVLLIMQQVNSLWETQDLALTMADPRTMTDNLPTAC